MVVPVCGGAQVWCGGRAEEAGWCETLVALEGVMVIGLCAIHKKEPFWNVWKRWVSCGGLPGFHQPPLHMWLTITARLDREPPPPSKYPEPHVALRLVSPEDWLLSHPSIVFLNRDDDLAFALPCVQRHHSLSLSLFLRQVRRRACLFLASVRRWIETYIHISKSPVLFPIRATHANNDSHYQKPVSLTARTQAGTWRLAGKKQ